jgi:hypothetical protein
VARSDKQEKAQAAWDRIEALGGHGVWESDMVVVSFGKTKVTDEDLALFQDFPFVQILDLSDTIISDEGLAQLGVAGTRRAHRDELENQRQGSQGLSAVPPSREGNDGATIRRHHQSLHGQTVLRWMAEQSVADVT